MLENHLPQSQAALAKSTRISGGELIVIVIITTVTLLLAVPLTTHMIWGRAFDYPFHIRFVEQALMGEREFLPHPLFQFSVIGINAVVPTWSLEQAAFALMIPVMLLTTWILYLGYLRPMLLRVDAASAFGGQARWTVTMIILAVTSLLILLWIAPINLFTWHRQNLYLGYFVPNIYHNPTLTLLKPIALLHFLFVVDLFNSERRWRSSSAIVAAMVLMILGLLSKPNYAMSVIPAALIFAAWAFFRREPLRWRALLLGVIFPAVLIMPFQLFVLNGTAVSGGGFAIMPFEYFSFWKVDDNLLARLILSVLFPLALYVLYFKQARQSVGFNLAWLMFLVSLPYAYLLVEPARIGEGNFLWGAHLATTLLFVVALAFYVRQIYAGGNKLNSDWRSIICMVILTLHLISGIFWERFQYISVGLEWF